MAGVFENEGIINYECSSLEAINASNNWRVALFQKVQDEVFCLSGARLTWYVT